MSTSQGRLQTATQGVHFQRPHFNKELLELWVNDTPVKRLDIRATNQILILTAFEEENWPLHIDDPLHPNHGDGKARLRSAIHCLNGHQAPPMIHFFADGTGHGIRWELIQPPTKPRSKKIYNGSTTDR
jgi:hypothetical protein